MLTGVVGDIDARRCCFAGGRGLFFFFTTLSMCIWNPIEVSEASPKRLRFILRHSKTLENLCHSRHSLPKGEGLENLSETLTHKNVVYSAVVSGSMPFPAASSDCENLSPVFSFFIGKQQKLEPFVPLKNWFGACCLTILIYFNMFKGAMRPRHTYVCGFKHVGLQEKTCRFTGENM